MVDILLLNVIEMMSEVEVLDRPCMVFQRLCPSIGFVCVCRNNLPHLGV